MKLQDLTPGERLVIARRREGETIGEAAERCGVSYRQYSRAEKDESNGVRQPRFKTLEPYEVCFLLRRRAGMSLVSFAAATGLTRWWVCQMEYGTVNYDRLVEIWKRPSSTLKAWLPAGLKKGSR